MPLNGRRGGQWRGHRQVIDGILWRLRVGAPWRDVPGRYGPWQTCYDRFARWRRDGTWDRLLALAQSAADAAGELDWTICVDGTVVRADQHAARARHRPSKADRAAQVEHPPAEALGRSRGGLTTKRHLACDGRGRLLSVVLTPGRRHESTQLAAVLDAIRVPRRGGRGRPRKRPDHLIADKG
ncbi:MAG TPA: IS5 family transposase [Thermomicrobiales bacterium]|nr:IS5 family transposase [Thermomicrobiales bacterium]